jgi:GT2 family glycosyltransferase
MGMSVAVVILNYNGSAFLAKFLPQVIASSPEGHIYVADNGSTDDSIKLLENQFPSVKIIQSATNLGYAGGYNYALSQIDTEFYVLMNSDIEPKAHWLENLLIYFQSNPNVAAAQPFILSYQDPQKFEYAGAAGGYWDRYGYPFCRGRIFDSIENQEQQYGSAVVNWATGACLMIRSKVYWEVGGLDAYLFAHMEEIDLCWRIQRAGYEVAAVATSEVLHVGGGTLAQGNPKKTYLNFRNNLILLYKNLEAKKRFKILLIRMLLDGLAGIQFLIKGEFDQILAILKAHKDFYGYVFSKDTKVNLPTQFQNKVVNSYQGSIVWDYFIRKIKKFSDLKI